MTLISDPTGPFTPEPDSEESDPMTERLSSDEVTQIAMASVALLPDKVAQWWNNREPSKPIQEADVKACRGLHRDKLKGWSSVPAPGEILAFLEPEAEKLLPLIDPLYRGDLISKLAQSAAKSAMEGFKRERAAAARARKLIAEELAQLP